MGLEIERKFLVKSDSWRAGVVSATEIKQGYLNSTPERTVRIRIYGERGFITIKGKNDNLTRKEFEYEIPLADAESLIELCEKPIIEKTRHIYNYKGNKWEIDEFKGDNAGLIMAEVELKDEDQKVEIPEFIGEEVSSDRRYYNSSLIKSPYAEWGKK